MEQLSTYLPDNALKLLLHEMRNPLTNINLASSYLSEIFNGNDKEAPVKTSRAMINLINKNVLKLEDIIKGILDPTGTNDHTDVDLCRCVDEALAQAADRILLEKIIVKKDYRHPPAFINGNAAKLRIAFLNIIINAIEAMEKTTYGKLYISIYNKGNETKVIFKDNGAGMEPEVAERIFERHYTGKLKGLGMGLMHTKEILELHHASVSVNSLAGIGTCIIVNFSKTQDLFTINNVTSENYVFHDKK